MLSGDARRSDVSEFAPPPTLPPPPPLGSKPLVVMTTVAVTMAPLLFARLFGEMMAVRLEQRDCRERL